MDDSRCETEIQTITAMKSNAAKWQLYGLRMPHQIIILHEEKSPFGGAALRRVVTKEKVGHSVSLDKPRKGVGRLPFRFRATC